jgi:hypothetical protein
MLMRIFGQKRDKLIGKWSYHSLSAAATPFPSQFKLVDLLVVGCETTN